MPQFFTLPTLLSLLLLSTLSLASPHDAPRGRAHHAGVIARRSPSLNPSPAELYAAALKREEGGGGGKVKVLRKKDGLAGGKRAATCKIRNGNAVAVGGSQGSASVSGTESLSASTASSTSSTSASSSTTSSSAAWVAPTTTSSAEYHAPTTTSSSAWSEPTTATVSVSSSNLGGTVSGLLSIGDSPCGPCPSTPEFPNGPQWWLNCGIDSNGWNPPNVGLNQVVNKNLESVLGGVFSPCSGVAWAFEAVAGASGVPAIMLASFAMGESTCNPNAQGRNGEIGLMQITPANCPAGANCWDVYTNIMTGANLFKNMLNSYGGNVLQTVGAYNGWQKGQTVGSVNSAAVCTQRQNLDYLHAFFNGWLQGIDGHNMGSYRNLAEC